MPLPKPNYPGDAVKSQNFKRGNDVGFIAIQQYNEKYMIASYLPGRQICTPGDTPKTEPERSVWRTTESVSLRIFDRFCGAARIAGWSEI